MRLQIHLSVPWSKVDSLHLIHLPCSMLQVWGYRSTSVKLFDVEAEKALRGGGAREAYKIRWHALALYTRST